MANKYDEENMPGINYREKKKDNYHEENLENYEDLEDYEEDDHQLYEDEYDEAFYEDGYEDDYGKYQKRKVTVSDVKSGYKTLKGQGKIFVYYLLMVVFMFVVNILASSNIIPKFLQYILLLAVVGFTLFNFSKQHANDEDTLD